MNWKIKGNQNGSEVELVQIGGADTVEDVREAVSASHPKLNVTDVTPLDDRAAKGAEHGS